MTREVSVLLDFAGAARGLALRPGAPSAAVVSALMLCVASCAEQSAPPIHTASDAERNALFLAAIEEAGLLCAAVIGSEALDGRGSVWRVVCDGAVAYSASVEADGGIDVAPIPYGDFGPRQPPEGPQERWPP